MKEKSRSISTNFIYNFVRTFAGTIFPVITFSYSSRILGAEGIGKLSFSKSIISYFSLFAMLGIHHYGTREVAKLRNDRRQLSKFAQEMLILNGVTTLLAYCALAITISVSIMLQQYAVLLWITSLSIFFMAMGMEWLYQGLEEYRYISLRSITFQIIAVSIMLLTVRDKSDLAAYAIVSLVASSGSYILNFWNCRKYIDVRCFGQYDLQRHMKPILWLFAFTISVELYTVLDSTMLGLIKGDRAVGIYSAAVKVNKMTNALISSLGTVLLPRLSYYLVSEEMEKIRTLICKAYNFVFMLSIPACVGLCILSDSIILLFSGQDFETAGITMRILTLIVLIIPFNTLTTNQLFIAMNKEKKILHATLTGAGINFACNLVMIPRWAENGAAVATVLAEAGVMCVCFYHVRKMMNLRTVFQRYYQYWIAAASIIAIHFVVSLLDLHYLLEIVFTVSGSALCYFFILYRFKNEYFLMAAAVVKRKLDHEK